MHNMYKFDKFNGFRSFFMFFFPLFFSHFKHVSFVLFIQDSKYILRGIHGQYPLAIIIYEWALFIMWSCSFSCWDSSIVLMQIFPLLFSFKWYEMHLLFHIHFPLNQVHDFRHIYKKSLIGSLFSGSWICWINWNCYLHLNLLIEHI